MSEATFKEDRLSRNGAVSLEKGAWLVNEGNKNSMSECMHACVAAPIAPAPSPAQNIKIAGANLPPQ